VASAARNPWVAIDVATDPLAHARRMSRAHERGLAGNVARPGNVRDVVLKSWERSLVAGVVPDQGGAPVRLGSDELESARERSPLAPVVRVIQSTLDGVDHDARQIVAISDERANLLWVTGDPETCERARAMRFQEGAAWSEQEAGTNAVGTAAALDHALQIFAAEHLVMAVHPWTCSAAPIHEPATGAPIGVVDLTAPLRTSHPHTLSLALFAARAAESALALRALKEVGRLREQWETRIRGRRTPSALLDAHGTVIASRGMDELPRRIAPAVAGTERVVLPGGRVAELEPVPGGGAVLWLRRRSQPQPLRLRLQLLGHAASARLGEGQCERGPRSLELLAVLAMHPEGMTAEQLALALYGECGKTVTVRARVHRVRSIVGVWGLTTHPYQLNADVDADWLQVQRLVSEGKPNEALGLYRGPLLPSSDAPAIVEARSLLEESLRRSILTTADPELLCRWLAHPSGADDLAAARTLVAVLPCGDPRRAAATATAAAIARRLANDDPTPGRPSGTAARATRVKPSRD
jgi:hypothetical protein